MNTRLARAAATDPAPLHPGDAVDELDVRRQLGVGDVAFTTATERLACWATHRSMFVTVTSDGRSDELGATVLLGVGIAPVRWWMGCRVVEVVSEQCRAGFAYATLPGHPVRGVERFTVTLGGHGVVTGRVQAWSQPADRALALAGPLARREQNVAAAQYLRRLRVG